MGCFHSTTVPREVHTADESVVLERNILQNELENQKIPSTHGASMPTVVQYMQTNLSIVSGSLISFTEDHNVETDGPGILDSTLCVSASLEQLVGKTGLLTPSVRRSLSIISNCSVHKGAESRTGQRQLILLDEETGDAISIKQMIGEGGYGKVFLAEYQGRPAAVKAVHGMRLFQESTGEEDDAAARRESMIQFEALLMSLVSGHPYIVETYKCLSTWRDMSHEVVSELVAACNKGQNPLTMVQYEWFMIMEYCSLGTLWHAMRSGAFHHPSQGGRLQSRLSSPLLSDAEYASSHLTEPAEALNKAMSDKDPSSDRSWDLSKFSNKSQVKRGSATGLPIMAVRDSATSCNTHGLVEWDAWAVCKTLLETVVALQFLHTNGVVHGDLKAANILLSAQNIDQRGFVAKVADFGFSRFMSSQTHLVTKSLGTVTHQPPELLIAGILSPSADVYSFGVLMWEVYTAGHVHQSLSDSEVVAKVIKEGLRPNFPQDTPERYQSLAERCWAEVPSDRPGLVMVEAELRSMLSEWSCQPAYNTTSCSPAGSGMHSMLPPGMILVSGTAPKQTFTAFSSHVQSQSASHAASKTASQDIPGSSSTSVASNVPQRHAGALHASMVPTHVLSSRGSNPSSPLAYLTGVHKQRSVPLPNASNLPRSGSTQMHLHILDEEYDGSPVTMDSGPSSRDVFLTIKSESSDRYVPNLDRFSSHSVQSSRPKRGAMKKSRTSMLLPTARMYQLP
ncbi:hypothetical protein CEUSTIGMA_g38.t1 [Chlamydomonas eustigma]|uniref:Protein kinase domain-containing protein n=1 Tax=Chlamydomonas eustigma TaxID=1157962 RepID=A0A250WPK1_9CHLO|nr:hypothetical protein CEUSTIGMA_g38.t1 [Chlamydomonas eustigma]|eukprot:GAX72582.1 hypothetical protein CEUSTIGMA_g38.t1 [Chlamydomonas eustigma]